MTATVIGYARTSTLGNDLDRQQEALREAGCDKIYVEQRLRSRTGIPRQRSLALKDLRPGVTLAVTSLDRLGHNLDDLSAFLTKLLATGGYLRCIDEGFDTADTGCSAILAGIASAGRIYRAERSRDGIAERRANGGQHGRSWSIQPDQWPEMRAMIGSKQVKEILAHFGISKQTFYNFRKRMESAEEAEA